MRAPEAAYVSSEATASPKPVPHIFRHLEDVLPPAVATARETFEARYAEWRDAFTALHEALTAANQARDADTAAFEESVRTGKQTPARTLPAALAACERAEVKARQTREAAALAGNVLGHAIRAASEELTGPIFEAIERSADAYEATQTRVKVELEQAARDLHDAGSAIQWARPHLESIGVRLGHFDTRPSMPHWESHATNGARSGVQAARRLIAAHAAPAQQQPRAESVPID